MPALRMHSAALAPVVDGISSRASPAMMRPSHLSRHQLCPPGSSSSLLSHGRKVPSRVTVCSVRHFRAAAAASSGKLSEASLNTSAALPIEECLTAAEDSPGIYAIIDSDENLQYIGMSKNIRSTLERHREKLPGRCVSAKALALPSTASKVELQQSWKLWMGEYAKANGALPPGNQKGNKDWVVSDKPSAGEAKRRNADAAAKWQALPPQERFQLCNRTLASDPTGPIASEAFYGIGMALLELNDEEQAVEALERAVEEDSGNKAATHILAGLRGTGAAEADKEYVAGLFDNYADRFDSHLVGQLEYKVPALLAESVAAAAGLSDEDGADWVVMDLGCGTGLSGEPLKRLSKQMVGVDLSGGMLEKAKERGIYDELIQGDVCEEMEKFVDFRDGTGLLDLCVAADVLVYVGALEGFVAAAGKAIKPGGLLAFSVEDLEASELPAGADLAPGFLLLASGRFAHSRDYVCRLTASAGFEELHTKVVPCARRDQGRDIQQIMFVFRRPQ